MISNLVPKSSACFKCESCDYTTCRNSQYTRHLLTAKHIRITNLAKKVPPTYECKCGKKYKYQPGLSKHKRSCNDVINIQNEFIQTKSEEIDTNSINTSHSLRPIILANDYVNTIVEPVHLSDNSLIMELIKQNQEFKEMMIEQNKTMMELAGKTNNHTTNNNIKNNQNNFNINMFLNEKCKDAISLEDFVNSLQINTQTAEYVGKHGFVNGITHIFMTGLKQLEVHMRPFHCTDLKRETIYVKGETIWAKDNDTNTQMMGAIKDVSVKNMKQLPVWIEENPDSKISGTDKYEEQIDIMKGMLANDSNKEKVLKNLAKEVMIDKNHESVV